MNRSFAATVILSLMMCSQLAAAEQPDLTGTWEWKFPNQSASQRLNLRLEGNKLSGGVVRRNKEIPLEKATYKDGKVSFTIIFTSEQGDGMKIPSKFSGTVSGDTIKGTIEYIHPKQTVTKEWNAKRVEASDSEKKG